MRLGLRCQLGLQPSEDSSGAGRAIPGQGPRVAVGRRPQIFTGGPLLVAGQLASPRVSDLGQDREQAGSQFLF